MHELAVIYDLIGRAGTYAALRFSADTADPANGALLQKAQERATAIETTLLFFELEWAALPDERVEELLGERRPGLLPPPPAQRAPLPRPSAVRARGEDPRREGAHRRGRVGAPVRGADLGDRGRAAGDGGGVDGRAATRPAARRSPSTWRSAASSLPDREVRRTAAEAVTAALAPGLRTRAFVFNTLLADKATDDRLRRYPHWLAERNLANEASDESVRALIEAVRRRYEIPRRWYRLKARLLGVERLADYDRMAAVTEDDVSFSFAPGDARSCSTATHPSRPSWARWPGASSTSAGSTRPCVRPSAAAPSAPRPCRRLQPYVLLNYTARRRDVLTLAHELGHGVHFALAARQGIFHQSTPLTLAETASVFGETIVFGRLLEEDTAPASRLALLAENLEDTIATVFRQVAMNRFEELVHTARREQGELSVERFGELWAESQGELLGDSVELTEGYRSWWSYVPHFIGRPGYVYAYAYGQLLALSVYERYEQTGAELVPRYLELLAAGGSRSPQELGEIVGIDLADPGFWEAGLDLVERQLKDAERGGGGLRAAVGSRADADQAPPRTTRSSASRSA